MIDLTGCIAIPLLKKSAFTGSYRGMRYRLKKETVTAEEEEKDVIRAVVWPEPFAFQETPDEQKKWEDFPFGEEGLKDAVEWLNKEHEEKFCIQAGQETE